jgi:hypothetical protein
LVENFLWLQNHFLENRFEPKIFIKNVLVENCLWLQNHFLENRFEPKIFIKIFWSKIFYGCNIISSKTGLNQNFSSKFLVENFLWLQNHFLENRFEPKIIIKNFLVEKFLWLQNNFLENRFEQKIFIKHFLAEKFYGCKIISQKTGLNQKSS